MGLATIIWRRQGGGQNARPERRRTEVAYKFDYRCVYRGANESKILQKCLKCPGAVGYGCFHPQILAKRRPHHICLIDASEHVARSAFEEGHFVCSKCKYRTTFSLPKNPTWAVGVVTAPRKEPTLHRTLLSLKRAGFVNVVVFAEPHSDLTDCISDDTSIVERHDRLGAWSNWYNALRHLVSFNTDIVFLSQDDVIYTKNLRKYLESNWPDGAEFVSPYCSSIYTSAASPFYKYAPPSMGIRGALSIILARETAKRMLESNYLREVRRQSAVDGTLGRWARNQGIEVYFCHPSLGQHIGDTSTMHGSSRNVGLRRSSNFPGEDYDPNMELWHNLSDTKN